MEGTNGGDHVELGWGVKGPAHPVAGGKRRTDCRVRRGGVRLGDRWLGDSVRLQEGSPLSPATGSMLHLVR